MIDLIKEKISAHINGILAKPEITSEEFDVLLKYLGKLEFEIERAENKKNYIESLTNLIGGVI